MGDGTTLQTPAGQRSTAVLRRHVQQLVDALDRREPHPDRESEAGIARDANALRAQALQLLQELDRRA